jgi:hypothetical protein
VQSYGLENDSPRSGFLVSLGSWPRVIRTSLCGADQACGFLSRIAQCMDSHWCQFSHERVEGGFAIVCADHPELKGAAN